MKTAREVAREYLDRPFGVEPKDFGEMLSYKEGMEIALEQAIRSYGESVREDYRRQDAAYKVIGRRELLEDFCRRMEEWGYIDSDWWSEEPDAIDRYEQHLVELTNKGER